MISPDTTNILTASLGSAVNDKNLFAYCDNNPIMRTDGSGDAWGHWIIGGAIVVGCGVALVVTCGGAAPALLSIGMLLCGGTAATAGATITAGLFIGTATTFGGAAFYAACNSTSLSDFRDQGNWGTVLATAAYGIIGGGFAYLSIKEPKTKLYRSVGNNELKDIKATGQFNLGAGQMEGKFFATSKADAAQWGSSLGSNNIVSTRIPISTLTNPSVTYFPRLDAIGPAYYFSDINFLNSISGPIKIY